MKLSLKIVLIVCAPFTMIAENAEDNRYRIDADFPGGNVIVDRVEQNEAFIRQDLRDTKGDWFYWCFRVKGAAGRTLKFTFTKSNVLGVLGPGMSADDGKTWRWLGRNSMSGQTFSYAFKENENEVYFSFGMPYQQSHLQHFLDENKNNIHLKAGVLCESRKGRPVEKIRAGCIDSEPKHRVLLTARHHACEMMANYVMEGLLDAVISDSEVGQWYQNNVEVLAIPFMDKDGVEDGDQGKNRKPRDHNRDYVGESIYPSVRALRAEVPKWSRGKLHTAIDIHCPYIRGNWNEQVYLVGAMEPDVWKEQRRFAAKLEKYRSGPIPFRSADCLPFGTAWNTQANYTAGKSFGRWAAELSGITLATTIEIPYANAREHEINQESARLLGKDMAVGLYHYLRETITDTKE